LSFQNWQRVSLQKARLGSTRISSPKEDMNSFPIDMQHRIFEHVMFSIARQSAADIESKTRI